MSTLSKKRSWKPSFPYEVDYNDHFETPLRAYQDIEPIIDWIHPRPQSCKNITTNNSTMLYDPYYCNGRAGELLKSLGYAVQHEKRDFYQDIRNNQLPNFDVLVTNPPYSDRHKEQCLNFCADLLLLQSQQKPFFLLLPSYVVTRSYYRQFLHHPQNKNHDIASDLLYLAPKIDYQYDHPEGTGKDVSPFASLWICGVGRHNVDMIMNKWNERQQQQQQQQEDKKVTHGNIHSAFLYRNLSELEAAGLISTERRPNPKQRQKKRKRQHVDPPQVLNQPSQSCESTGDHVNTPGQKSKNKSKYRDETGMRRKKRF